MNNEMNNTLGGFVKVDKNLIIETKIDKPDIKFYDVRQAPFDVYGFYEMEEIAYIVFRYLFIFGMLFCSHFVALYAKKKFLNH